MKPKVLTISLSPIERDARVLRQIKMLAEFTEVTTVGYGGKPEGATSHIEVPANLASLPQTASGVLKLLLRAHSAAELAAPAHKWLKNNLPQTGWDLIVANDARVLDLVFSFARDTPVWADMHEWAPEENTRSLPWRLLVGPFMRYLCAKYLHRAVLVTTVSSGIVELYQQEFGVTPLLMSNNREYVELAPSATAPERIRCVHSGAAIAGRGLETMIEVFRDHLDDRFSIDFYLVPGGDGGAYLRQLQSQAAGCQRIKFQQAVTTAELPAALNQYDLGVYWITPTDFNQKLALPNKFFDFVQARLGVAIGPSVEMVREVQRHNLGVVSTDFSAAAAAESLRGLSHEQVVSFKQNAALAAKSLSFEAQVEPIRAALQKLL